MTTTPFVTLPATNGARFDHLIALARKYESWRGKDKKDQIRAAKLAGIYRDMAFQAMPSATAINELNLGERSRLKLKLLAMTVENGCTPAEADNAAQLLLKLEGGQ